MGAKLDIFAITRKRKYAFFIIKIIQYANSFESKKQEILENEVKIQLVMGKGTIIQKHRKI